MKKLLIGNAAVARGAYEAGANVVASYPGTPSTEITEEIVKCDEILIFCGQTSSQAVHPMQMQGQ